MNPSTESATASSTGTGKLFRVDSSRELIWLVIGSLVFALILIYPMFCDVVYLGPGLGGWISTGPHLNRFTQLPMNGDTDMFDQLRWVPYYTVTHFHQWPFWNPYKCGGMTMLGNPESGIVTPFFILYLALGLVPGLVLEIYLHIALGFAGGFLFGRELGLERIPSVVLAGMFLTSSWLSLHLGVGHLNFLPTLYIPWILAFVLAACRLKLWYPAALAGLLCGLTLTEGNYPFVFATMLVAVVTVILAITSLSVRPLIVAAVVGAFAIGFAALKLVPVAEWMPIHPRDFGAAWLEWRGIASALFSRNQSVFRERVGPFFFTEDGGYLSPPFLTLALIGAVTAGRKSLVWVLGIIVFVQLYRGDTGPHALITYLRMVPLASNMGLSGRWVIPLTFCAAVLAALGAQYLWDHFGTWGPRLAVSLLVLGLIDSWIVCSPNYRYLFYQDFQRPESSQSFRQFWNEGWAGLQTMTYIAQANMGSVNCTSYGYYVPRGKVLGYNEPGYHGEYSLLGGGEVTQTYWSPNVLSFDVSPNSADTLVINQNFDKDWKLSSGQGTVVSQHGLLAVSVPQGHQTLTLSYRPQNVAVALLATIAAMIATLLLWWWETRNQS